LKKNDNKKVYIYNQEHYWNDSWSVLKRFENTDKEFKKIKVTHSSLTSVWLDAYLRLNYLPKK
jgi:hypothetical protein